MANRDSGFGPHLALDLQDCDPDRLDDLRLIYDVLYKTPEMIGMTRITLPYVFPYEGVQPDDRGITGTAVIAESHMSIHTFVLKRFAFIDIFSCKNFDHDTARNSLVEAFAAQHHEYWLVHRGRAFPQGKLSDQILCDGCLRCYPTSGNTRCCDPIGARSIYICPYCGSPSAWYSH